MPSEAHLITSAYNVIVDALFGYGFRGPTPEPDMAAVIQTMMKSGVPIASIDIPSGRYLQLDPSAAADRRIRRRKFVRRKSAGKITARRISRRILLAINPP